MPRQKITDEIETLRRQKAQLDARLKAAEDRRKEHEAEEKKRRKLLLGGIILDFMLANPDTLPPRPFAISCSNMPSAPPTRRSLPTSFPIIRKPRRNKKSGPGNQTGAA
jgi:hypothetical protein